MLCPEQAMFYNVAAVLMALLAVVGVGVIAKSKYITTTMMIVSIVLGNTQHLTLFVSLELNWPPSIKELFRFLRSLVFFDMFTIAYPGCGANVDSGYGVWHLKILTPTIAVLSFYVYTRICNKQSAPC